MMAHISPGFDSKPQTSIDLEPELHEGDGKVPSWIWIVVAIVTLLGAVVAPFQLVWPFS